MKVVTNGILDYYAKHGRWTKGYGELFKSGVLPASYRFAAGDRSLTMRVTADLAEIHISSETDAEIKFQLVILGEKTRMMSIVPR